MMTLNFFLLLLGFAVLIKGGDLFVDASIKIARILNLPRIVVGSTIVSLATTSPEMVVSITASFAGDAGIALGNAVGSAIANAALVLGVSAILNPIRTDPADFRRRCMWMLLAAVLVTGLSLFDALGRTAGIFLTTAAAAYLAADYFMLAKTKKKSPVEIAAETEEKTSLGKSSLVFVLGAVLVIAGSRALVTGALGIAEALGIPSLIIGLTVIAVGTSLPELVTAVISAKKGASDLSVGNIIGANILNLLGITGLSAMVLPLTVDRASAGYSYFWLFAIFFAAAAFAWKDGTLGRRQGTVLAALYVLYVIGLAVMSL